MKDDKIDIKGVTPKKVLDAVCKVMNVWEHQVTSDMRGEKLKQARVLYVHLCHCLSLDIDESIELLNRSRSGYYDFYHQWDDFKELLINEKKQAVQIIHYTRGVPYHIVNFTDEEERKMKRAIYQAKEWAKSHTATVHEEIVHNKKAYAPPLPPLPPPKELVEELMQKGDS